MYLSLAISRNGKVVFSAGGADRTVNVWNVDVKALDDAEAAGGGGVGPFLKLLDGGEEGELYRVRNCSSSFQRGGRTCVFFAKELTSIHCLSYVNW